MVDAARILIDDFARLSREQQARIIQRGLKRLQQEAA